MLSEISQKRQIPYDLTCMWNLKQNRTKENKLKLIVTGNRLVVARGRVGDGQNGERRSNGTYFRAQIRPGDVVHDDYGSWYCAVYLKGAKRINLKSSHHRKNTCNYVW